MSNNHLAEGPAKIYSVGYGNRSPEQLFDLIKSYGCSYLIDVRSAPYSSYHKEFNRETLQRSCDNYGLKYLYLGDRLGGKPGSEDVDELGVADYARMGRKPIFVEGLQRLQRAQNKDISVVLMCAELRPETCHRTKLIGTALAEQGIEIFHIDEKSKLKTQKEVLLRVSGGQSDLFG